MGVKLHNPSGLDNFKNRIGEDVSLFMTFSRGKAEKAQSREFVTVQPKESLSTLTKAKITITNFLGGQYFFTVDEINITNKKVILIESKHTKKSILPSKSDIKDGLLKMILYSNLTDVSLNGKKLKSEAVLCLTSTKLIGEISSNSKEKDISTFFQTNNFTEIQFKLINKIFTEANNNNFIIKIKHSK